MQMLLQCQEFLGQIQGGETTDEKRASNLFASTVWFAKENSVQPPSRNNYRQVQKTHKGWKRLKT
jgi:hypothetical protein